MQINRKIAVGVLLSLVFALIPVGAFSASRGWD